MRHAALLPLAFLLSVADCTKAIAQNETSKNETIRPVAKTQRNSPQAFAHFILKTLQQNNATKWQALYPTHAEFKNLLQLMLPLDSSLTQARIDTMVAQRKAEAQIHYKEEFIALQKQAKEAGIDWSRARYSQFIYNVAKTTIPRTYINGDIWFNIGRTEYVVEGIEAVETESGYKLQAVKGIRQLQEPD